jgi:hypothetical protein
MNAVRGILILIGVLTLSPDIVWRSRLDLQSFLSDPAEFEKVTIWYRTQQAGFGRPPNQIFFVYGSGRVVLQSFPHQQIALPLVPTCTANVDPDRVRDLIHLMIDRHFFDLPERNFIYTANDNGTFEEHAIWIDSVRGRSCRAFGVGRYQGKNETIPAEFKVFENALIQLSESTFKGSEKPCHMAPVIK